MEIMLKNEHGVVKQVKIGFSWTVWFFDFLPAIFRKDAWGVGYILLIDIIALLLIQIHPIFFLVDFIAAFTYNRFHAQRLLNAGYKPLNAETLEYLRARNFKC